MVQTNGTADMAAMLATGQATSVPTLISVDVGNVNVKLKKGGVWVVESSRVAKAPVDQSFSLGGIGLPVFTYLGGPANLHPTPYFVGDTAELSGATTLPIVGTAERRVKSAAYLVLHLYSILQSLSPQHMYEKRDGYNGEPTLSAYVRFAGGVPQEDATNQPVVTELRRRLSGKRQRGDTAKPHFIKYGPPGQERVYQITIENSLVYPQPVGGYASHVLDPHGNLDDDRSLNMYFLLDIGGGTTDMDAWVGLNPLQGMGGSVSRGIHNVAQAALHHIQRDHPQLRSTDPGRVLDCIRRKQPRLQIGRQWVDVSQQIGWGLHEVGEEILGTVNRLWGSRLADGEVLIFGGGGDDMHAYIAEQLRGVTDVTLLENPVTTVADGFEKMAKFSLKQQGQEWR
jgi:hypothetical protein